MSHSLYDIYVIAVVKGLRGATIQVLGSFCTEMKVIKLVILCHFVPVCVIILILFKHRDTTLNLTLS